MFEIGANSCISASCRVETPHVRNRRKLPMFEIGLEHLCQLQCSHFPSRFPTDSGSKTPYYRNRFKLGQKYPWRLGNFYLSPRFAAEYGFETPLMGFGANFVEDIPRGGGVPVFPPSEISHQMRFRHILVGGRCKFGPCLSQRRGDIRHFLETPNRPWLRRHPD